MQQATINLPSTNPVRALTGLARQIALPAEFAPERFPSFPALERTAVMAFTQPTSWSIDANVDRRGFLCRQAAYPLWLDISTSSLLTQSYHAIWISDTTPATINNNKILFTFPDDNVLANYGSGPTQAAVGQIGNDAATTLFGQTWPVLAVDSNCGSKPFMYVPPNFTLHTIVAGTSSFGATAWTVGASIEKWVSPGVTSAVYIGSGSVTSNTGVMLPANSQLGGCWVRPISVQGTTVTANGFPPQAQVCLVVCNASGVTYTPSVSNMGTFTMVTPVAINTLTPVSVPNEFANSALPWQDTRVTAVGALFTNVTQVLNKGGTVIAGRISPGTVSPWLVSRTNLVGLHPAEKAFLPLETGLYTYCPPSTDMALFFDYATPAGSTNVPVYRLDNTALVNHFILNSTVASTMAVNCSWHFEFRTSSALFQLALSGLTLEALHGAQLALAAAGFFFENPEHNSVLNRVINAAKKVAPHLLNIMDMHPVGRVLANAGRALIPTPAPPKMKPTSAAASGIVPSKPKRKGVVVGKKGAAKVRPRKK